jgi:hypothetical protein
LNCPREVDEVHAAAVSGALHFEGEASGTERVLEVGRPLLAPHRERAVLGQ